MAIRARWMRAQFTRYKDDVQSYSTTEPAVDLTASSFLMWSVAVGAAGRAVERAGHGGNGSAATRGRRDVVSGIEFG